MRLVGSSILALVLASLPGCLADADAEAVDSPLGTAVEASGGGNLQISTPSGLFVIDHPAAGEPSISGMVLVMAGKSYPPADTVVTLDGVQLVRVPGLAPRYWQVDPAGPQPALGADGVLHLSATSSAGSRLLDLACPATVSVTATPAAGSSLAGVATLGLSWDALLPAYTSTEASFGIAPPSASLFGYTAGTNTLGAAVDSHSIDPSVPSTTLTVGATASTGYLSEIRYPGVYLLDGNSGGVCGRTVRTAFAN
jgi:hypothetical protein